VPLAFTSGSCNSNNPTSSQSCGFPNSTFIAYQVSGDLATLTSSITARQFQPASTTLYINTYYFVQLYSATGTFSGPVPIWTTAAGFAEVGGFAGPGGTFNNAGAMATVRAFNQTFSACAGTSCQGAPSFSGSLMQDVRPGSGNSGVDPNIWRIEVSARVDLNSNYATAYGNAWADPVIAIDPAYAALHPELSLVFSGNLPSPVPEPATSALLATGLLALQRLRRRQGGVVAHAHS